MPHATPRRTLALTVAAALGAATLAIAGCAAPTQRDGSRDAPARAAVDDAPDTRPAHTRLGYRLEWRGFPVLDRGETLPHIQVLDDVVITQSSGNLVTVMDTGTGANRWSARVGQRLERFTGFHRIADRLICVSQTELKEHDIETGALVGRQRLSTLANTEPAVVGTILVVGSTDGEVLGHSIRTGYRSWGYLIKGTIRSTPVHLGGTDVAVVSQLGDVIIIDTETGSAGGRRASIYAGLANDPVADERRLYIAGLDQSIWAFDRADASLDWRVRTESRITAQPALIDGVLYVHLEREGLTAHDGATGERLWANPDIVGDVIGVRDGRLIAYSGGGRFTLVDRATGDEVLSAAIPRVDRLFVDAVTDGSIYAVIDDGSISKFSPSY